MAIPFIIGAGAAILIGGSCASWILNRMSAAEERQQTAERGRQSELRKNFHRNAEAESAEHLARLRQFAKGQLDASLELITEYKGKEQPIRDGISDLYKLFKQEMAADSTSPYRRTVLQREYCLLEDANARLEAYSEYLQQEKIELHKLFDKENFDELMSRDIPQPLLPMEWLYPGKLILVTLDEIGILLPKYDHQVGFSGCVGQQQALAVETGQEFPLLVTSRHQDKTYRFYGCVARGLIYLNHIRVGLPLDMEIFGQNICQAYGGLIKAILPRNNLLMPTLNYINGQNVTVYPELFDLCLNRNPFAKEKGKRDLIVVSEHPPAEFGGISKRMLFLEVEDSLLKEVTDKSFFSETTAWTLIDYDLNNDTLILGKANVRVVCQPDSDTGVLIADEVHQMNTPQMGIDIGFNLVIISAGVIDREAIGWPMGITEFVRFALQMTREREHTATRVEQARFMRRWEQVLDYQIAAEHSASIEFVATLTNMPDIEQQGLLLPKDLFEVKKGDKVSLADLHSTLYKGRNVNFTRPERCFHLEVWNPEKGIYLQGMRTSARLRASYEVTEDGLLIIGRFDRHMIEKELRYRFSIKVPSVPLDRQREALGDFFNDRLVNPAVKDLLLSPTTYIPSPVQYTAPRHFFQDLTPSQKVAIELSLSPDPLVLIQGPPGTGKTTVIVELLLQLLDANPSARLLMVSQQNAAVDNALSRFMKVREQRNIGAANVIRVGNIEKVDDDVKEMHLDSVQERLHEALQIASDKANSAGTSNEEFEIAAHWRDFLSRLERQEGTGPDQEEIFVALLADMQVVGATCVGLASRKAGVDAMEFDYAIIDEAGRSTVPELLIPILRAKKVVMIGDHHQLPPSIAPLLREDGAHEELGFLKETFLDTSFFEILFEGLPDLCKTTLDTQFRMAPAIGNLVTDLFYTRQGNRQLSNSLTAGGKRAEDLLMQNLYWVDVKGKQFKAKDSKSLENSDEVNAITSFLKWLASLATKLTDVAVITPYGNQKRLIRQRLKDIGELNGNVITLGPLRIRVDTVDSFQGSEASVVCYSLVRTSPPLDFILDGKRLNVSCSRAQRHLVFFGHKQFLSTWKSAKNNRNLFSEVVKHVSNNDIIGKDGTTWSPPYLIPRESKHAQYHSKSRKTSPRQG